MAAPLIALTGTPNSGKTALFNALTGRHQKVANYPGVTVEKKEGVFTAKSGKVLRILDLPGAHSLTPASLDEEVAFRVLTETSGDDSPDALICVADAANLERSLSFVLELRDLGTPVVLALNMFDLAKSRGLDIDLAVLEREIRLPVVPTVAIRRRGVDELMATVEQLVERRRAEIAPRGKIWKRSSGSEVRARFNEVDRVLKLATRTRVARSRTTETIDRIVLNPKIGYPLLFIVMALLFQAVFAWAEPAMEGIEGLVAWVGQWLGNSLPDGWIKSIAVDGVVAGVGSVLVFLPQIVLLFFFILLLEDSGYLSRAAFLMDRLMGSVGLNGHAFIPLLSGFACAIPGVMATRTIPNPRDRLTTILLVPLMTCSARLPVYTLLISAFVPNRPVWGPFGLQGAVMFGLYVLSIPSAFLIAFALRKTVLPGERASFILELPTYKIPNLRNLIYGLYERVRLFLMRAGKLILATSIVLWVLVSFPKPPADATAPAIEYSIAGVVGRAIEPVFRPVGFDWRIVTSMIPGFAAREVMVAALGTVFAVQAEGEEEVAGELTTVLAKAWPLPTALALLAWYVYSPQCLSTFAVIRRETNSWKWTAISFSYMLALAYAAAFVVYRLSSWLLV